VFLQYLKTLEKTKPVVWTGDINVSEGGGARAGVGVVRVTKARFFSAAGFPQAD